MIYSSFAFSVIGLAAAGSAYGDFKDSALIAGRQLATMGVVQGQHQRVRLNGELVHFASAMTDKPVSEVLDRIETACRQHAGDLGKTLPLDDKASGDQDKDPGIGVIREDGSQEGWVGCLWQEDSASWTNLPSKLRKFTQTGDLSDLGDLRYVYAKQSDTGKTHVISVWTDGPFHIVQAFAPPDGSDTPGSDSRHVPRPTNAQRLLTAQVEGAPYAVRIYDADAPDTRLLAMYDKSMPKLGWTPIPHATDRMPGARVYTRQDVDLLVLVVPKDKRSFVSIVEMKPR